MNDDHKFTRSTFPFCVFFTYENKCLAVYTLAHWQVWLSWLSSWLYCRCFVLFCSVLFCCWDSHSLSIHFYPLIWLQIGYQVYVSWRLCFRESRIQHVVQWNVEWNQWKRPFQFYSLLQMKSRWLNGPKFIELFLFMLLSKI